MEERGEFGVSKRGKRTLIYRNCEFWLDKCNQKGETVWRCSKRQVFKCTATVKTKDTLVVGNKVPEHNHGGNVANALARKAVGQMKVHMQETIATPSASQGAVVVGLSGSIQMALPKRASLSRALRRHRLVTATSGNNGVIK
jgi:hypothetical protein